MRRLDSTDINDILIMPGDEVTLVYARGTSMYNEDGDLVYELSDEDAKSYIGHKGKIWEIMDNACFFDDLPFAWPTKWVAKF